MQMRLPEQGEGRRSPWEREYKINKVKRSTNPSAVWQHDTQGSSLGIEEDHFLEKKNTPHRHTETQSTTLQSLSTSWLMQLIDLNEAESAIP